MLSFKEKKLKEQDMLIKAQMDKISEINENIDK